MYQTNKAVYAATIKEFLNDVEKSNFLEAMKEGSYKIGLSPSDSEMKSWSENSKALKNLFRNSILPDDVYIVFEYQVPIGGRIDCMLFGEDKGGKKNAVHIELKQWSNEHVEICYDGYVFKTQVEVEGYRGEPRHSSHPSAQAEEYQIHLENHILALDEKSINLSGLAYCYNYKSNKEPNVLCGDSYKIVMKKCPLFCEDQKEQLVSKLEFLLDGGKGSIVFNDFITSEIRPTIRLQEAAKKMFDGNNAQNVFALVGDQLNAYNEILGAIEKNDAKNEKTVVVVKGGPGTGKSVIAMQLVSGLAKTGKYPNVYYTTRSTSLIEGYKEILKDVNYKDGNSNGAIDLIKKNSKIKPIYGESGIDALVVDEAHRIEKCSNDMNDKDAETQTHLSQIMNMIFSSRVCVFFIDDLQSVKSIEIGTSENIKEAAVNYYNRVVSENNDFIKKVYSKLDQKIEKTENELRMAQNNKNEKKSHLLEKSLKGLKNKKQFGLDWVKNATPHITKVNVIEIELKDQFRCNGSNNYIDWIERVLYKTERTKQVRLDPTRYEFDVFDNPKDLYSKIRALDDFAKFSDERAMEMGDKFTYRKINQEAEGMEFDQTARLVAGWCWEWKQKETEPDGDLKHEIIIPEYDFSMPWETLKKEGRKPSGFFKDKYAPNQDVWIIDKRGVNQVGCNHSSQGWETDYIGVIIANDLKYDPITDSLYGDESVKNYDSKVKQQQPDFTRITKNIYRILLTRGKKGCFVFACDPGVRDYFRRCMKK